MTKKREATIGGKNVSYHANTRFLIRVGYNKGRATKFKTEAVVTGNLGAAVAVYDSIEVDQEYVKQLVTGDGGYLLQQRGRSDLRPADESYRGFHRR